VHVFNADRCSYTRGEPALTSAVDWIDKVTRYADAALVAAHVNALFVMAITKRFPEGMLPTARPSQASTETSDEGFKQEKLGPGLIYECGVGEDARAIAPAHPSADFDPFILRCLSFIGRPLCFPLTYVSGDFAGATYMNMRFALDLTRDNFIQEQEEVIVPLLHRWHRWQMERWIQSELNGAPEDWYKRLIRPKRWRYIDALKDAQADILLMEKRLKSRRHIMGDRGYDFDEETDEMMADERILKDKGLAPVATEPAGGSDDGDDKEDDEERQ
jgi:capsid protein